MNPLSSDPERHDVTSQSVFEIASTDDPRRLTQAMIQIIDCLNMYQAELARVLNVQCADIGQLSSAAACLQPDTTAWRQAQLFLRFYRSLYARFDGEGAAMIHWCRAENKQLEGSPHLLIVDENRLADVVGYLETHRENSDE